MALSRDLTGRLAVVTGATSGIGRATALRLMSAGARVVAVARTQAALDALQRDADALQRDAEAGGGAGTTAAAGTLAGVVAADVATEEGVAAVAAIAAESGPADLVVHAAGAFELMPLAETSVESFDRMLAVNLRAAFLLVRAFVPDMLLRGRGQVILIGSVAGRQAFPSNGAYSASKFGLRGMHAVLAAELRGTGVRATLVEPAATDTPLWDKVDRDANPGLPGAESMLAPAAVAAAVLCAAGQPGDVVIPNILVERA